MTRNHSGVAVAMITAGLLIGGCGESSKPAPPAAAQTNAPAPAAAAKSSTIRPTIVSITPDTIEVHDGHAVSGGYDIVYEIANPERVTKAELGIYARRIGEVQKRIPVQIQEKGTLHFDIDPTGTDFGPTVRFRAKCPEGETAWYTLGSEALPFEQRMAKTLQVTNVSPDSILPGESENSGIGVTIFGQALTSACVPLAEVNGLSVELMDVHGQPSMIRGLLMHRDLNYRFVSARYFEVKLALTGPGARVETITHVRFAE